MYKMTTEQMAQIKTVVGKGLNAQKAVFNALDFNPYDDAQKAIESADYVTFEEE